MPCKMISPSLSESKTESSAGRVILKENRIIVGVMNKANETGKDLFAIDYPVTFLKLM